MQLIERVHMAQETWRTLLPFCPEPEPRQFAVWMYRFNDSILERAFWRASKKFSPDKGQVAPELVHRYCTGVMLNEERER
jgi:hypothetical protein